MDVVIAGREGRMGMEGYRISAQADLPESGEKLIDEIERVILGLQKETLRSIVAAALEAVSKERADALCASAGGVVVAHPTRYRVDSEVGRISFRTYDVKYQDGTVQSGSEDVFPAQGPREYYRTAGMSELLLANSCC